MSGCGHETDMPTLPPDVCFRGQIGHAVQAVQLPANDLGPRPEPDFGRFQRGANSRGSRPQRRSITAEMWRLPCPLAYFFPLLRPA